MKKTELELKDINNKNLDYDTIYKILDTYNIYNTYCISNLQNLNVFSNLKELNFVNNRNIDDYSIQKLTKLEKLVLPKNKLITNKGLLNLKKLKYLDLSVNTNIDDKSIINKTNIEYLKLVFNKKITDKAFINIKKLKYLNLGYNNNKNLKLNFLENNKYLTEIILYRKKNLSNNVVDKIKTIKNINCYQLQLFN